MPRDDSGCKIYVGDLPRDAEERELESAFKPYGPLRSVWVARNPPGFAFVVFEDSRDAEEAVRGLDGSVMCGVRARVEISNGRARDRRDGGGRPLRKPFSPDDKCYECGRSGHYAYDCAVRQRRLARGRSASRSASRSRSRERPRRRSRDRARPRSRSRSFSRSRSRDVGGSRSRRRS